MGATNLHSRRTYDAAPFAYTLFSAPSTSPSSISKNNCVLGCDIAFLKEFSTILQSSAHAYSSVEYSSITIKLPASNLTVFTPFLRRRNGVCRQVVCSFVRLIVRTYVRPSRNVRLCTSNKLAEPRGAIFCIHIHIDKVPSPANFHPNGQRP